VTKRSAGFSESLRKFLQKPAGQKLESIIFRLRKCFPAGPTEITLPFGAKWLAASSALDGRLRAGEFESAETSFVLKFLQPGMIVVDIGAHHGFYTLLASIRVGASGRVIAFEPSPRERSRLVKHIQLNKCGNVEVVPLAVARAESQMDLYVVEGAEDYCNSLRPPATQSPTHRLRVEVTSLDEYLSRQGIEQVHFLKLDTEGAELEVLRGSASALRKRPRPVVMSEVAEIRTAAWGYSALEIVRFMQHQDYQWFRILPGGSLAELTPDHDLHDTNLVAVPKERLDEIRPQFVVPQD
jgi:FkbM family methyltransferase